jgi:hypothetical protein
MSDLEQIYKDTCTEWITLRDQILQQFVDRKDKFVTCKHCKSVLSREHARQLYIWTRANCLVCRSSLLETNDRKKLQLAAHKRETAYAKLHNKPLPKFCGDVNIEPHLASPKRSWWGKLRGVWNG